MNKKLIGFTLAFTFLAILATPLTSIVQAKRVTETDMGEYTEYVGTLGDANFVIRIPDEWNGMLVVGCHGYQAVEGWNPDCQFALDYFLDGDGDSIVFSLIADGYAYAASSYGRGGFAYKEGMIRTHQLTEYVIENYGVTGKVLLLGYSQGGTISLLLGEKYPNLYDGVLDIYGLKDMVLAYEYGRLWASHTIEEMRVILGLPPPSVLPDALLLGLQAFLDSATLEMETSLHGTPEEKPKAWERFSPASNAEITIPVVSVNQPLDLLIPITQIISYATAVAEAGSSEYLKTYINMDIHFTAPDDVAVLVYLDELVNYPTGW